MVGALTPTGHTDVSKPQYTFALSITPGNLITAIINDKGVIFVLNEAARMHTKRENEQGGVPQLLLIREAAENCSTVEEAKVFLRENQAASSHTWIVLGPDGYGVFEHLPIAVFQDQLFNFRGYTSVDGGDPHKTYHATNHFFDEENKSVAGSEAITCSNKRYCAMEKALEVSAATNYSNLTEITQATSWRATVQTFIFKADYAENTLEIDINNAKADSSHAVDPDHGMQINYTKLNLSRIFANFARQVSALQEHEPDLEAQSETSKSLVEKLRNR